MTENQQWAAHLWAVHAWQATAKMVDGPEHLARVCEELVDTHHLEHVAAGQGIRLGWRPHDHTQP
jgi:hypothetical protein